MKPHFHFEPWKKLLVGLVIAVLCLQENQVRPAASQGVKLERKAVPAAPSKEQAAAPVDLPAKAPMVEVIVERPTVTPLYGGGPCGSGWIRYTNNRGSNAFLSLNVTQPADSAHSAEWRPQLQEAGTWEIEAYIPSHGPATWNCPDIGLNKTISRDTSHARYIIHHRNGQSTVTVDQHPLNNQWVSLGKYEFPTGSSGYVTLTDVTGEISATTTVSYSAMRFTYQPYTVHLPVMRDFYPSVLLNEAWASPPGGLREQSFYPGDALRLSGSGVNSTGAPAQANIKWTVSGDCQAGTLGAYTHTEIHTLEPGDWMRAHNAIAPNCTGYFTYTLQVDYKGRSFVRELPFVVNDPGAGSINSIDASFDRCEIPTISQLDTWWKASPYRVVNLYIGGIHRACGNTGLTAAWLRSASQMGWTFIPTWVGLQGPGSIFAHKISTNASTAYTQGRSEADKAIEAATKIALPQDSVIYYDLEAYAGSSITSTYRNAVKAFMNGWVERLEERGRKAGAYGSPSGSYMADWLAIDHVPEYVWLAVWYQPYYYDPYATVWVPNHLSNSYWANHQRIRQYTNSHTEEWGGLRLTIDSNIDDGAVVTLPRQLAAGPQGPWTGTQAAAPTGVQDARLIDGQAGWSLAGGRLRWTSSAGLDWADITPQEAVIEAASFPDTQQGWALGGALDSQESLLFQTVNAGQDWQPAALPDLGEPGTYRVASLQFIDARTGWIAVQHVSSSNFSLGSLWKTEDGGQSWERLGLPLGEPVRFLDASRGWTAGGAGGDELYTTRDGGRSWQAVALSSPGQPGQTYVSLPVFADSRMGLLTVTQGGPATPRMEVYTTQDGGETWTLAQEIPLAESDAPGSPPLAAAAGAGRWIIDLPRSVQIYRLNGAQGLLPEATVSLPEGALDLHITNSGAGWARTAKGACSGSKPARGENVTGESEPPFSCELRPQLWLTTDGGSTWTEISP